MITNIVKVIEVSASSETGFDNAIKSCINKIAQTVSNMDAVYVKDFKVHLREHANGSHGVMCKVSLRVEESAGHREG